MAMHAQSKLATPYMGHYGPVNLYRGGRKISGWTWAEQQGAVLEFGDTYNDVVLGTIGGRSEQKASVWGENIITNGDFSQGAAGWTRIGSVILSAADNALSFTATSQWGGVHQGLAAISDHKYYASALIRANSPIVRLVVNRVPGYDTLIASHSGSGNYERLSVSGILPSVSNARVSVLDYRTSAWAQTDIKYLSVIDLTAAFGVGKEPTTAQIDAMLAQYPNSWFNGKNLLTTDTGTYTANSPSPEYPSPILMAGNCNIVSQSADGGKSSSIAIPILRSLPNGVKDTLTHKGGGMWEFVLRIGHIASYNGEAIITPYISTTGELTAGAEVYYQLAEPVVTLLPLGELKTYPHETQIHQDTTGLKADLSLKTRVVDKEV